MYQVACTIPKEQEQLNSNEILVKGVVEETLKQEIANSNTQFL